MEKNRVRQRLAHVCAVCFIGSAIVAQAQDAELPFTPILTIGRDNPTSLVNDEVWANSDGSFTLIGTQSGGLFGNGPVWELDWDLTVKQDPFIAGSLTLTNRTSTTRNFNLAFLLPITPAFSPSLFGGSLSATLIDFNGDLSATLATSDVSPSIYRGTIDGITVLSLFSDDITCFGSSAGCIASGTETHGLPGPTLPGPAVNSAIGIFLNFSLSAGDRVTFNTNFTVEPPSPVPVPAALPLMLSGLGALVLRRRKSLKA